MKELIIFRNNLDGLIYYSISGVSRPLNLVQDDIFKNSKGKIAKGYFSVFFYPPGAPP